MRSTVVIDSANLEVLSQKCGSESDKMGNINKSRR